MYEYLWTMLYLSKRRWIDSNSVLQKSHCTFVIVGLIYVAESAMSIRRNISEEPNICMHGGKGGSKELAIDLDSI